MLRDRVRALTCCAPIAKGTSKASEAHRGPILRPKAARSRGFLGAVRGPGLSRGDPRPLWHGHTEAPQLFPAPILSRRGPPDCPNALGLQTQHCAHPRSPEPSGDVRAACAHDWDLLPILNMRELALS